MGSITVTETIEAPVAIVFEYVDDYRNTTKYMKDLTRWEPLEGKNHGKGAIFAVAMQAGPKSLESTVVISTWTANKTIAWDSRDGFTQKGRWSFVAKGDTTVATFEMSYDLGGGIAGKMLAKVAEPIVRMNIQKSVVALREITEKKAAAGSRATAATKPAAKKPTASRR